MVSIFLSFQKHTPNRRNISTSFSFHPDLFSQFSQHAPFHIWSERVSPTFINHYTQHNPTIHKWKCSSSTQKKGSTIPLLTLLSSSSKQSFFIPPSKETLLSYFSSDSSKAS
uniref:Uncharacterized protein n=1 Tax=Cacopsylla melanoneura TaxID=428564 RepID=A0A8D9BKC2_9HEMI